MIVGIIYFFFAFYWHNAREKPDNCKVLIQIKNKPEILLNKIEACLTCNIKHLHVYIYKKKTISQSQTPTQ